MARPLKVSGSATGLSATGDSSIMRLSGLKWRAKSPHIPGSSPYARRGSAFILKQPEHIQERGSWQHATELTILAAERGGNIEAATSQIEDALFLEARYVRQWHL